MSTPNTENAKTHNLSPSDRYQRNLCWI